MPILAHGAAAKFTEEVAVLLDLPLQHGDAEVRRVLKAKGSDYLAWYDNRVRAIVESIEDSPPP